MKTEEVQIRPGAHHLVGLVLLSLLSMAATCSTQEVETIPFTHDMPNRYGINSDTVGRVQFYMGNDCVLEREYADERGRVLRGELIYRDNKTIEVVAVPLDTPGVGYSVNRDSVKVSFERGTWLEFGTPPGVEPGPGVVYELKTGNKGCVLYDGKCFQQVSQGICYLKVSARNYSNNLKRERTLPGVVIGEDEVR